MGSKMLIDSSHPEETRVVVARGTRIEEFDFESASRKPLKGNIYLAKVTRVEPSLQAAFVEYGGNRHGFLAFAEIHPDYYQIPIADRLALLAEQEAEEAEDDDDDHAPHDRHAADHNGDTAADAEADHQDDHGDDDHPVEAAADEEADGDHSEAEDEPDSEAIPLEAEPAESISSEPVAETSEEPASAAEPTENAGEASSGEIVSVEEDAEARKVETLGNSEDALEEVAQRRQRRQPRRRYKIQEVIKRRQILLVQVVKEERGNKGAALTTYMSLAGRYCVLMPNTARGGGISRKITDANDRRRLKEVARDVEVPQGMGLIVRTAGAQRTRPEIKRDFDYLIRLWESVRDLTLRSQAPCLVYEEGNLIKRSIRDLYTKDVDEVIVEGDEAYREAKDFMKMLMPSHAKNVKLYKDTRPLFSRYQVENHLDGLLSPTVTLPSGGYIVINQTEALVSIDINSGKATREHSIEDTALKTNLEACDEIARQLRLRDLAGLIVIDFIDMEENRNNRSVERRIKEALKNDRARIQVGRISHFGLLEMSRQRLRPGITEGTFRTCPHCEGRGIVRSVPSCGLGVLRSIEDYLLKRQENLTVKCAREVAFYLLNEKRDSVLALEQAHGITIFIVPAIGDELKGAQVLIERATDRDIAPRRLPAAQPVRIDSAFEDEPEEEDAAADTDAEQSDENAAEAGDEGEGSESRNGERSGDRDGRRRRRRGRRGRRGDRDRERSESTESETSEEEVSEISAEAPHEDAEAPAHGDDEAADEIVPAPEGEESGDAAEATDENGERPPREERERGGRRGRFGRDRGRRGDRNRGERKEGGERQESAERPREREERGERPRREDRPRREGRGENGGERRERQVEYTAPPPSPVINIPEVIADPEPRKWQPPQANVQGEAGERKSGWWSKKK
ncbi:MAG: Rne/Rng family ribonuclease [Proteobacteria bacterium]|nr:Rne/Rng family ribonuclease [Pseudomonadota bacterium]